MYDPLDGYLLLEAGLVDGLEDDPEDGLEDGPEDGPLVGRPVWVGGPLEDGLLVGAAPLL